LLIGVGALCIVGATSENQHQPTGSNTATATGLAATSVSAADQGAVSAKTTDHERSAAEWAAEVRRQAEAKTEGSRRDINEMARPPRLRAAGPVIVVVEGSRAGDQLIITGRTQGLPSGTKLWVEITRLPGHAPNAGEGPMDNHVFVAEDGTFKGTISKPAEASFPAGTYDIKIMSYFSRAWQSVDVLKRAGVRLDSRGRSDVFTNPTAIPESADFKPDDPEFPKDTRHLEAKRKITVGALAPDLAAINVVKDAVLVVQGMGRSGLSVGKSVDYYASAPGVKVGAWSAAMGSDEKWVVTLDVINGESPTKAKWRYDPKTKTVNYLDPLSKTLSYVTPY
jgi:hypothetical protein